jgi:glycosyltransferase involved in cell wall biosynthesis
MHSDHQKSGWPWTLDDTVRAYPIPEKKSWPKISIITPSLNQGQFLEQTIRSVLLQGYPNLEYIIIDGGSSDHSVAIIKKYASQLTYWVSEPDRGHGHALNKGFARATGEILAWLNSDDMYTPYSLYTVAEIFDAFPDIHWLMGRHSLWNDRDQQTSTRLVRKNTFDFLTGNYGWIQQESTFWRRSLWERAGGNINERYRFMVDGELWCRFFPLAELWHVDTVLGGYRIHSSNRATVYRRAVVSEMRRAIAELRKRCPAELLKSAQEFNRANTVRHLARFLPFQKKRADRIFRTYVQTHCKFPSYRTVKHCDGTWTKEDLPYHFR